MKMPSPEIIFGLMAVLALVITIFYKSIVREFGDLKKDLIIFLYAFLALSALVMIGGWIKVLSGR